MSYTKVDGIPCRSGEVVVQLDTGDYVAVSSSRERGGVGLLFRASARAVNEDGSQRHDANGKPIESILSYAMETALVDDADSVSRDCILAVLGEHVERWDEKWKAGVSIRTGLQAAPMSGPVDAGSLI